MGEYSEDGLEDDEMKTLKMKFRGACERGVDRSQDELFMRLTSWSMIISLKSTSEE